MFKLVLKNIAIYAIPALVVGILAGVFGNRRWGKKTSEQAEKKAAAQ